MERPNHFIIFQFGDGNSESTIINIPRILLEPIGSGNNGEGERTPATSTREVHDDSDTHENYPQGSTPVSGGTQRGSTQVQNNMTINVNYVYSVDQAGFARPATATGNDENRENDTTRTGTLLLNVPNIPTSRTDSQLQELMQFAASLALSAIAAGIRRKEGIPKEIFDKYPIRSKHDLEEKICPICYDEYDDDVPICDPLNKGKQADDADEEYDTKLNESGKRRRSSSLESHEGSVRKSRRVDTSTTSDSDSHTRDPIQESHTGTSSNLEGEEEAYKHVPVELPCKHLFGRSCLHEWLKTNTTCPLCRHVLYNGSSLPNRLNLPNIRSLINLQNRDRPLVIVLDRRTNTLRPESAQNSDNATNANESSSSSNRFSYRSFLPQLFSRQLSNTSSTSDSNSSIRDSLTTSLLQGLNQSRSAGLFTSGVMSRRTDNGVETVPIDQSSALEDFYETSRRLVEQRLRDINNEEAFDEQNSSNTNDGDNNPANSESAFGPDSGPASHSQ